MQMAELTKNQMIALVWQGTTDRQRGRLAGERAVMVPRGNELMMVPLRAIPFAELRAMAEGMVAKAHRETWRTHGYSMVHHWWPGNEWAVIYGTERFPAIGSLRTGRIRHLDRALGESFGALLQRATAEAARLNKAAKAAGNEEKRYA